MTIYEQGLAQSSANFTPLSPLSLLRRAASIYPDKTAVIHHQRRLTWGEIFGRCQRVASALTKRGIGKGDTVAILSANTPEMFEAHFGIPACGAVLNTINTRLDSGTISYIFEHGEAKVIFADTQFLSVVEDAIKKLSGPHPTLIEVPDIAAGFPATGKYETYEKFLETGDINFTWVMPKDEWESLALNYTSGTTGKPKGVVYHHRGAY